MSIVGGQQSDLSILQLIASDPQRFQQEIQRFEDAKAEADRKLAMLGMAGDIESMRAQMVVDKRATEEALAAAMTKLADARSEAEAILANARLQAQSIVARGESDAKLLKDAAQRKVDEAEAMRSVAEAQKRSADVRQAQLTRQEELLERKAAALDSAKADAENAKQAYTAARERLNEVGRLVTESLLEMVK